MSSPSTFVHSILQAMRHTAGNVLQIGADPVVTAALHGACALTGRKLVTYEKEGDWLPHLRKAYESPGAHEFRTGQEDLEGEWGLVVLHCGIPKMANDYLTQMAPTSQVIVCIWTPSDHPTFKYEVVVEGGLLVLSNSTNVGTWGLKQAPTGNKKDGKPEVRTPLPDGGYVIGDINAAGQSAVAEKFVNAEDVGQARRVPEGPPPKSSLVLYNVQGHSVSWEGHWKGDTAFLVLSGPSAGQVDLTQIQGRGFVTMCVNNSWSLLRPTLWTCVDDPCTMLDIGWKDPGIMKLVPYGKEKARLGLKMDDGQFKWSGRKVREMPNVWYYKRNDYFKPDEYLSEPTVNWGNHQKTVDKLGCGGSRSVMLAAFRLLYYLGFKTIVLVGADFKMAPDRKYAFAQERDRLSIKGNNNTYRDLNIRFKYIKPQLDAAGVKVFNTCPDSGLEAFEHIPFEQAVGRVKERFDPAKISPEGWYSWRKEGGEKLPEGINPPRKKKK